MKKLYFISGLGADERVFKYLKINEVEIIYIKWVKPDPKDSVKSYSEKLIDQIDQTTDIFLAGVSFGGMICQEISKLIPCKKVIIISSIKAPSEFGWQLNLVRKTKIHLIFPAAFLKYTNLLTGDYYFSTKSIEESRLLRQIILDTDNDFMKWAINAIMNWSNPKVNPDIIHIHGTKDKIFPLTKNMKNVFKIEDGGHFMIVNRADEISIIINSALA